MVMAVVTADFTDNGVAYKKGQKITIPEAQYDEWVAKKWVSATGDPTAVADSWVGPSSDGE